MTKNDESGIEVFQDLYLRHAFGGKAIREAVLRHLSDHWVHRPEREEEMRDGALGTADVIALARETTKRRKGVSLWMFEEPYGYKVSNIVPLKVGELGIAGYNDALKDFVGDVVVPAARDTGFEYELTSGFKSIEDWADSKTATALKRFSSLANKSTGRGHPLDEKRWLEFLIAAHLNGTGLDTESLLRWLIEIEKWPAEIAQELAFEYGLSRTLLSKYDEQR